MVRLINKKNLPIISGIVFRLMKIQEIFTYIRNIDHPDLDNCIYAMWHANQFLVHGLPNRKEINILISTSLDGEIVANVCENWGFKVRRGSAGRKGSITATKQMLDGLKNNESVAIMVDGPHGPYHVVKKGAIVLSKDSNVPIVPVHWYSEDITFRQLPSWDKMTSPIGPCRIINLYGEPIYTENKTEEQVAQEIEQALYHLEKLAPQKYKEAMKAKLWKKKQ